MYLIDINKIESGDIILSRSNDRESELIRQWSKSDYSHAILYVGVSSCIESGGLGVQSQNLQRLLFDNIEDAEILRLNKEDYKKAVPGAIVFARQKIGTEYSSKEARLAILEKSINAKEDNRQYCTRFVAQAYNEAGIKLVDNPDYCSPQEILESPYLTTVQNAIRIATDTEIEFALKSFNPIEKQIEIHNEIFESSRNISGQDIQTFEQLSKFVLENPSKEPEITEVIKKSGYFNMWEWDIQENPWHYEYDKFLDHYINPFQRKEVGYFFATTERETRIRYILTLNAVKFGYNFYQQEYFKLFIELYERLIQLSFQRQKLGLRALID